MKKALKIAGITLGSLIGLVLIVVFTACYLVFTPQRLTPIVNQVADSVLTCEHSLEKVELTFWRTFPNFGVEIDGLYVINPVEGAQSDTVLAVPELVVGVDLIKAIDGNIEIKKFRLSDVEANVYIGADGQTNLDILDLETDTTEQDTTPSGWRLNYIGFEDQLAVSLRKASFVDKRDSVSASLADAAVKLSWEQLDVDSVTALRLDMESQSVCCTYKQETYADNLSLQLTLPVSFHTSEHMLIHDGRLAINEFEIRLDGEVGSPCFASGIYTCDLNISTNEWKISDAWHLVPASMQNLWPKQVDADGHLQLAAHIYGQYDSLSMPVADAQINLLNAQGRYTELPYYLDEVEMRLLAHADLNNKQQTTAQIERLYVRSGETHVTISGDAVDILQPGQNFALANPLCNLTADLHVSLPDADYWIQSDQAQSHLKGLLTGQLKAQTRLNDVLDKHFNQMNIQGNLTMNDLDVVWQDSTLAQANQLTLQLTAPKAGVKDKNILSANCRIGMDKVTAQVLSAQLDAVIASGSLNGSIELDTKDTTHIPTISAGFDMSDLVFNMDTIHAHATQTKGQITQSGSRRNRTVPKVNVRFSADALQANMGQDLAATTGPISIIADARYNKQADKFLLKWNPRLQFDLQRGHADIAMVGTPIDIPQIKFAYSNRDFEIDTSRIVIGRSDFGLAGQVHGLGQWIQEKGELTGDLRFTSDVTDVNELLDIINHFNAQNGSVTDSATVVADTSSPTKNDQQSNPFMVPERVNLTLHTVIKKAYVFNETLQNLGGNLYIKDKTAILEEIGFVCQAAKLQLTAMYKTPRRDHIYVGLDYHMIDIDLQELISMIPQLDTLVPMLRSFKGGAQFHIAAETYVNDKYELKPSTIRGACSIEGSKLVLLDNETFSTISKILMFSKKTENIVDSISVQIGLYKDEITVYPFSLSIDNYMAAVGGNHYLDMSFNYHASLLKPFYLGVDVSGTFDDLKIRAAKCRYAQDFRPIIHKDTETKASELKQIIATSLKKNVKIQ